MLLTFRFFLVAAAAWHHDLARRYRGARMHFDWLGVGLTKFAEIAVVGLIGLTATWLGLAPAKDITDPQNWPLWAVLVLLFATYQICWTPLLRGYLRWRVPRGHPGKINILLARLQDKNDDSLREIVRDAITKELRDAVEIIPWPEAPPFALALAQSKARKWLRSKSCDVFLWGREIGDKTLALRFTVLTGPDPEVQSYGLTSDTLELPVKFVSDLGAAIAARIVGAAAPAILMSGHYLVPVMRACAERLELIVTSLNPAFDADTRGSLLFSYGLVRGTIGDQAGSSQDLQHAVAAYRAALQEFTRERVPLQWAMTQNDLGNALLRLGERESGTARLDRGGRSLSRSPEGMDARARAAAMGDDPEQSRQCVVEARRARERHGAARRGGRGLSRSPEGKDARARAAALGHDPEQSRQCVVEARRARERHGAARGGGRGLSRSAEGKDARARAAGMGHDPEQSRHCAVEARRARERHGAARRGGRGLSRSAEGKDARARAAAMGHDPEQSRHCVVEARRARERHGAARGGGRGLSRGPEGKDARARAAATGP